MLKKNKEILETEVNFNHLDPFRMSEQLSENELQIRRFSLKNKKLYFS